MKRLILHSTAKEALVAFMSHRPHSIGAVYFNAVRPRCSCVTNLSGRMDQHLWYLDESAELHERTRKSAGRAGAPRDPLERIFLLNPDMMLEIAKVRVGKGGE